VGCVASMFAEIGLLYKTDKTVDYNVAYFQRLSSMM